jgi:hypothetical protein
MAKRNLARTTRKHGMVLEDLMMLYFEKKVCDFSVMVLYTNSKIMEILIPKAKQIPKKSETSLHLISDSAFYVVWDDVTGKWCPREKKLASNSSIHLYRVQRKTTDCQSLHNTSPLKT